MAKTAAHIIYRNLAGRPVPGATTALAVLNKPALVSWANRLGLQGIDSSKYVDDKAVIGTLAHYMIISYLQRTEPNLSDYSQNQIDQAETCLIKFWDWEKEHSLSTVLTETPFVSEAYNFGGTIDWYGKINDHFTLIDFKTSSGIFPEMSYQLAAYSQLLREHSYLLPQSRIIRVGRNQDEGFEERVYTDLQTQWQIFEHCLAIYNLRKKG